jgi:hypothetical protein
VYTLRTRCGRGKRTEPEVTGAQIMLEGLGMGLK